MAPSADADILKLLRAGDRDRAFEALVETHGKAVYNIALFTLNDEVLAEDATQDAFIKMYRGLERFEGRASLSTWIYRIVKNVCYDTFKRRRTQPLDPAAQASLADGAMPTPEEQNQSAWRHNQVRAAVARLPEKQRLAVTLYYFQDKSYEEVAAIMEQPLNTIKSHLHRAKAALTRPLGQFEGSLT
ncbi:MAG: sigma-70 family RNA polymerase sigma factor [Candidatus Neomarinimicrobiota bacterium]